MRLKKGDCFVFRGLDGENKFVCKVKGIFKEKFSMMYVRKYQHTTLHLANDLYKENDSTAVDVISDHAHHYKRISTEEYDRIRSREAL